MRHLTILLLLIMTACLSCKKTKSDINTPSKGTLVKTQHGEVKGTPVTATIGAAGGSLTSSDGRLVVTIPAGAVESATTFSVQAVTNMLKTAAGAYRLLPEGINFKQDITITYACGGLVTNGAAGKDLFLAFQDKDGYYHQASKTTYNASTQKLTVKTRHFSDWTFFSRVDLTSNQTSNSGRITLKAGQQARLQVRYYLSTDDVDPYGESPIKEFLPLIPLTSWTYGPALGSLQPETLIGAAVYTAPAVINQYQLVQVTVKVDGDFGNDNLGQPIKQMILTQEIMLEPNSPSTTTDEYLRLTIAGQTEELKNLTAEYIPGWITVGGYTATNNAFTMRMFGTGTGTYPFDLPGKPGFASMDYLLTAIEGYIHYRPRDCNGQNPELQLSPGGVTLTKIAQSIGEYTEGTFSADLYSTSWCGSPVTKQASGQFKIMKRQ